VLGGGALFFLNKSSEEARPPAAAPSPPAVTQTAFDSFVSSARHVKGDPNAQITIVEFADFQCPSCRRLLPASSTIWELKSRYGLPSAIIL
jgi:protein-disulfide isomerase